jgi:DNA-binding XRE family transcriptional regulator
MPNRSVNGIFDMDAEKLISPVQCKGARGMLGLSQEDLAAAVGVSDRTIHGFERRRGEINRPTRIAIRKVLEARGARFVESGDQVGVLITVPRAIEG